MTVNWHRGSRTLALCRIHQKSTQRKIYIKSDMNKMSVSSSAYLLHLICVCQHHVPYLHHQIRYTRFSLAYISYWFVFANVYFYTGKSNLIFGGITAKICIEKFWSKIMWIGAKKKKKRKLQHLNSAFNLLRNNRFLKSNALSMRFCVV